MMIVTLLSTKVLALSVPSCSVPKQLSGKKILFTVDEEYSQYSPEVVGLMELYFDQQSFVNYVIQDNYFFPGKYSYRKIAPDLARIELTEIIGNLISKYQLVLVCITDIEGYFFYTLNYGERVPKIEHNTGSYVFRE